MHFLLKHHFEFHRYMQNIGGKNCMVSMCCIIFYNISEEKQVSNIDVLTIEEYIFQFANGIRRFYWKKIVKIYDAKCPKHYLKFDIWNFKSTSNAIFRLIQSKFYKLRKILSEARDRDRYILTASVSTGYDKHRIELDLNDTNHQKWKIYWLNV